MKYLVCGCQPWSREIFDGEISAFPGEWHFVSSPEELTENTVRKFDPEIVFFLHWSWKVPAAIVENFECIGFHPTDLPYGRGGTPIQNLILRGHTHSKLSAFRMTAEMDAGPIYLKKEFSLEGSAEEIYRRISQLAAPMIRQILEEKPLPQPQTGEVVTFKRRRPAESRLLQNLSPQALYDFIRMLDAPGYPKAFLESEGIRIEFENAQWQNESLSARAKIKNYPPEK